MSCWKKICWKTELKILAVERRNQTKTPQPQTLRTEQQKKIVSVKQDSARIFHGWTARTICQVALKRFCSEGHSITRGQSKDIALEKVWKCFQRKLSTFPTDSSHNTARIANAAWAYCKFSIFCPLIVLQE